MPRNLNIRQLKFAAAVAQGETYAAAYKQAGYGTNGKPATTVRNAKKTAKHPGIAARIQELQLQLLPAPEDMKAVYAHGLATIIQMSNSCEDSGVRLKAAQWLCAEAKEQEEKRQALEARRVARAPDGPEEIVARLRALYRKALPEREPLVEEVSDEMADGQGEATAENLPQGAGSLVEAEAEAEPAGGEDEAPEPGETATVEVSFVAEKLNPPVQFRTERIPGYFPARFRRVRVEP